MSQDITLTELMGARFCHDLAGPVSAVNNGLEFLHEDDEQMRKRAFELIESSSKEAVARLQFFRQAYGVVPAEGEVEISHLKSLASNFFAFGKITLDWPDQHTDASGVSVGHRTGRLILNLIVIASSCLIHGGTIRIRLEKMTGRDSLSIAAEGKGIKIFSEIADILKNRESQPMDKRNVQVHFTSYLVQQLGETIQVIPGEDSLQLNVERSSVPTAHEALTLKGNIAATQV